MFNVIDVASNNDSDSVNLERVPLFYSTIHIIIVKMQRFCLMTADDDDASVKLHKDTVML